MKNQKIDEFALKHMQDQTCYSLGGYTFEQWYKARTEGCYCWVGDYAKEELRREYEKLPTSVEVGEKGTIIYYSDRRAVDVVSVEKRKNGKTWRIGVKHRCYAIGDIYSGYGNVLDGYWSDEVEYFTLRRGGGWYAEGQPKERGSVKIALGYHSVYIDPHV